MIFRIPRFVTWMYPKRIWEGAAEERSIYLTFDDGPIPEVTPWVLEQLRKYNAKATFFCIGENVERHPAIFRSIVEEGHSIGNHTYNHLNGWKNSTAEYLLNSLKCQRTLEKNLSGSSPVKNALFRPPYGKIKNKQAKELQKRGFRVVMWSILSRDYDQDISPRICYETVTKNLKPGSIIVFHDSLKARKNLTLALPQLLEFLAEQNFALKAL